MRIVYRLKCDLLWGNFVTYTASRGFLGLVIIRITSLVNSWYWYSTSLMLKNHGILFRSSWDRPYASVTLVSTTDQRHMRLMLNRFILYISVKKPVNVLILILGCKLNPCLLGSNRLLLLGFFNPFSSVSYLVLDSLQSSLFYRMLLFQFPLLYCCLIVCWLHSFLLRLLWSSSFRCFLSYSSLFSLKDNFLSRRTSFISNILHFVFLFC
jgi:hypothetical protein